MGLTRNEWMLIKAAPGAIFNLVAAADNEITLEEEEVFEQWWNKRLKSIRLSANKNIHVRLQTALMSSQQAAIEFEDVPPQQLMTLLEEVRNLLQTHLPDESNSVSRLLVSLAEAIAKESRDWIGFSKAENKVVDGIAAVLLEGGEETGFEKIPMLFVSEDAQRFKQIQHALGRRYECLPAQSVGLALAVGHTLKPWGLIADDNLNDVADLRSDDQPHSFVVGYHFDPDGNDPVTLSADALPEWADVFVKGPIDIINLICEEVDRLCLEHRQRSETSAGSLNWTDLLQDEISDDELEVMLSQEIKIQEGGGEGLTWADLLRKPVTRQNLANLLTKEVIASGPATEKSASELRELGWRDLLTKKADSKTIKALLTKRIGGSSED